MSGLDQPGARTGDPRQPDCPGKIQADGRRHDERQRYAVCLAGLPSASGAPGPPGEGILRFPEGLVKDVIPFVDMTYRTKPDRENRAIAGLSMAAPGLVRRSQQPRPVRMDWRLERRLPLLPGVAIDIPAPANAATLRVRTSAGRSTPRSTWRSTRTRCRREFEAAPVLLAIGIDDGLITTHDAMKRLLPGQGCEVHARGSPGIRPRVEVLAPQPARPPAQTVPAG